VSADNQIPSSTYGEVRIVYHVDGTASVNGALVAVGPGQELRDAAYQAAVGLAVSMGATGPVVATSVEPDGAAYPVTLYPTAAALAAAGAAASVASESAFNRVRRAWYHPTLSVSWLAAAACACALLSVLATVLLHEDGPPVVRLSVDTENDPGHSPAAQPMGHAVAKAPGGLTTASVRALAKKAAATNPSASPTPVEPHVSAAPIPGIGTQPTPGLPPVPQPTNTTSVPSPSPKPTPTPTPSSTKPATVTNLTLALVGGDHSDQSVAYVATVSTSSTAPVTLTFTYAGTGGRATVTRTMSLSGRTSYVIADLIPAQPYCGGPVTMTAYTTPVAKNGLATATAQPGC
jgi:hypothetical protein